VSGRGPTTSAPDRPLRRDAADNRERLLSAAATVFTRDGIDAGIDVVAREAGIGMGTVYRRFPNKKALIDELVDALLTDLITAADSALAHERDGDGLEPYLRAAGDLIAERRGFVPMVWRGQHRSSAIDRLRATLAELLASAQRHGRASADVELSDISAVLWSMRGIMELTHTAAPDAWRRHLDFVLAGMRAGSIAFSAPAVARAQMDEIVKATD
jgi:AcrR family transcriptional regulator